MLSEKSNFFPIDCIAVFHKNIAWHVECFAFCAHVYLVSGRMKAFCDSNLVYFKYAVW